MKRALVIAILTALAAAAARGETVRQRWGGKDAKAAHRDTLNVVQGSKGTRLVFNLSAIPAGATVHHASLVCFTQGNVQPTDPARILVTDRLDAANNPVTRGEPLTLEAPWYRSFDATEAVRDWVKDPKGNLGFTVAQFERLQAPATYLEVLYDGKAGKLPQQAGGLEVAHHDGQTFIVFNEVDDFRPKPDEVRWVTFFSENGDKWADGPGKGAYDLPNHPAITLRTLRRLQGLAVREEPSGIQGIKPLRREREVADVAYRVYRHTQPITAANIHQAALLGEVAPLEGFDGDVYTIHFQGEYINQREEPESVIPTLCIDKGKPIQAGQSLYVHTAVKQEKAYYAVTTVLEGTENLSQIGPANSLAQAVEEKPGKPLPVLQWMQEDRYHKEVPEYWYRFWAAPPYYNLPSRSFRLAVSVPLKYKTPSPLHIGTISDSFNVRGSLNLPPVDAVALEVEQHVGWMPNLFYNEGRGTLRGMTECKVDYFAERYMSYLIHWLLGQYDIDRTKVSGSMLYFGLRHPEIFATMSFGAYTADYDKRWCPGSGSLPALLGPKGIKTVDGDDAWEMFSVSGFVNKYPQRDIPYLICISAVGKDSGHTSEFGWQDDPRGWAGLLKARQPFVAAFSLGPPRELSQGFQDIRWDVTLPAFSNCSIDNNPGNGDPTDGDYYGCINGWLLWDSANPADEKDRWEMTVYVISSCPRDACTVDVTPRHCANFKPKPGEKFKWTNRSLKDDRVAGSATVTADRWGLVTVPAAQVTKDRNRIIIERQ